MLGPLIGERMVSAEEITRDKAETIAHETLTHFMAEWNTGEDERLRTAMRFPFATFVNGAQVWVNERPEDFSQRFDQMREKEDWASSTFDHDSMKMYLYSEDKIHLTVDYNRFKADGEKYFTGKVFYILTKKDGVWGIQLRSPLRDELEGDAREAAIAESREVVTGYMKAFNASDADGSGGFLHYPHLFLINGIVAQANDARSKSARPDFDRMRESEDWAFSTFDSMEAPIVTEQKVHWEVTFGRWHPDGTRYMAVPAVWVTTKVDGEWGIQFRSLASAAFQGKS